MNYMINNEASKQVAIKFAYWILSSGENKAGLTLEERYEQWLVMMDEQAISEATGDTVDKDKYDDFERQLEYMSGAYEE
jgi:hypothetical protein